MNVEFCFWSPKLNCNCQQILAEFSTVRTHSFKQARLIASNFKSFLRLSGFAFICVGRELVSEFDHHFTISILISTSHFFQTEMPKLPDGLTNVSLSSDSEHG